LDIYYPRLPFSSSSIDRDLISCRLAALFSVAPIGRNGKAPASHSL
jgi:hypothetical protein